MELARAFDPIDTGRSRSNGGIIRNSTPRAAFNDGARPLTLQSDKKRYRSAGSARLEGKRVLKGADNKTHAAARGIPRAALATLGFSRPPLNSARSLARSFARSLRSCSTYREPEFSAFSQLPLLRVPVYAAASRNSRSPRSRGDAARNDAREDFSARERQLARPQK